MYELVLKDEVVDRAPLANLEQAKTFFMKRKNGLFLILCLKNPFGREIFYYLLYIHS